MYSAAFNMLIPDILIKILRKKWVVFQPVRLNEVFNDPLLVDSCRIFPSKNLKILGINFSSNLDWVSHVNSAINKANSMIYALRYLNARISRERLTSIIQAHFISKLTYASQVWSGSLSSCLKKKLESCYFKILRLLCRDNKGKMHRNDLIAASGLKSLRSLLVARDARLLHTLCTTLHPEPLVERLLSQCFYHSRNENKLFFYDYSLRKVGRASFINRAKYIAELIPFEWTHLSVPSFRNALKSILPSNLMM